jgi:hypothetical protein
LPLVFVLEAAHPPHLLAVQYFGAIVREDSGTETGLSMARYSAFLGRRVEVQYRAGDILLPASGTFVADSGRSIFLEQHLEQRGQMKQFRWEIPYQYIVRLEERSDIATPPLGLRKTALAPAGDADTKESCGGSQQATSKADTNHSDSILPLHNRPKPA